MNKVPAAFTSASLAAISGEAVLIGHSYGWLVITEACGVAPADWAGADT